MEEVIADPTYLSDAACTLILSEVRSARLSPIALHLLNTTLDELLQLVIHTSLLSLPPSTPTSSTSPAHELPNPTPLEPSCVLTIDRFKSSLQRIVGPQLGKECILEAELALREALRRAGASLRSDLALKSQSGSPKTTTEGSDDHSRFDEVTKQAEEIFRATREWTMQISGLGALCPPTGTANLMTHLAELTASRTPPSPCRHITFLLVLYIERCLTTLATHLLHSISSVISRSSLSEQATASDLEVAFGEDESIWSWIQGLRVRHSIEGEAKVEKERAKSPTLGSFNRAQISGLGGGGSQHRKLSSISTANMAMTNGSTSVPMMSRPSQDSYKSQTSAAVGALHYRRSSLAGSIQPSSIMSDDPFDQLLNSGQTMKFSMTPDRLLTIGKDERLRKASALNLSSLSTTNSSGPPSTANPPRLNGSSDASTRGTNLSIVTRRRLQARGPHQKDLFNEEDEDSIESGSHQSRTSPVEGSSPRRTKERLIDLLNSDPPWSGNDGNEPASTKTTTHESRSSPTEPTSIAMKNGASQNTVSSGMTGFTAESCGGEEAWLNRSPETRQRALKPKDERRDVASERQVNNDLMEFFSSPPLQQSSNFGKTAPASPPLGGKKSKGGLRGFMSKVTGGSRRGSNDDPAATALPPLLLPVSHDIQPSPVIGRPSRMRSISGQSNRSNGAASPTSATFALPPGLAETPEKGSKHVRKRSGSLNAATKGGKGERHQLGGAPKTIVPPARTDRAPVSILVKSNGGITPPDGDISPHTLPSAQFTSNLPPPIPSQGIQDLPKLGASKVVARPRRTSSLKRRTRSRETSNVTDASMSTTAETNLSPVVLIPNGLAISNLESPTTSTGGSHERDVSSTRSDLDVKDQRNLDSTWTPSQPRSDGSLTPQPLQLRQLLLVDSRRLSTGAGTTPSPPALLPLHDLSPVVEQPSSAQQPLEFDTSRSSTPASPPTVSQSTTIDESETEPSTQVVTLLEALRMSMARAESREECLKLVDVLLEAHGSTKEDNTDSVEGGYEERNVEIGNLASSSEEEEANLVEFFLSGNDLNHR